MIWPEPEPEPEPDCHHKKVAGFDRIGRIQPDLNLKSGKPDFAGP